MILSRPPLTDSSRRRTRLLYALALVLPLGAAHAAPGAAPLAPPAKGAWHAGDRVAQRVTGDLLITPAQLVFEHGARLVLEPARAGTRAVFAVEPARDRTPVGLGADQLCRGPITHVTMVAYHGFALALHLYEGAEAPPEPSPGTVTAIAQRGKCASYYYRARE